MGSRRKNRPNQRGRNPTGRFARLDHKLLESGAYRSLSPNARALLVEFVMLDNGANNGSFWLSVRDAADRIGLVDLTATSRAFDELREMGFIRLTKDAHFSVKASETSRARAWRLTFLAVAGVRGPTHEYLTALPPPGTKSNRRMDRGLRAVKAFKKSIAENRWPVLDSRTLADAEAEFEAKPVWESNTAISETPANPPKFVVRDSHTHTAVPMGTVWRGFPTNPFDRGYTAQLHRSERRLAA